MCKETFITIFIIRCLFIHHVINFMYDCFYFHCSSPEMTRLQVIDGAFTPWWRHQMKTFSALLAICAGNSPVTDEFPAQRQVTRSFDVFFDLCLNRKRLSKQSWGWWFETPPRPLWRHSNANTYDYYLMTLLRIWAPVTQFSATESL